MRVLWVKCKGFFKRTVIELVSCVRDVGFDASKVKVLGRGAETVGRVGAGEVLGGAYALMLAMDSCFLLKRTVR